MSNLVSMGTVAMLAVGGSDAAFLAVFGVFVAALLVLAVVTLRWAVRRDRAGRAQWLRRQDPARPNGLATRRKDQRKDPGTRA